jgi:hypothetical protein
MRRRQEPTAGAEKIAMTVAEECLWRELIAIVNEMDRVLAITARDKEWKEKDYARFTVLSAKFSGIRAAIETLQQREEGR